MYHNKQLKWIFIGLSVTTMIFVTIYYASVTRAENWQTNDSDSNLKSVISFVKQLLPGSNVTEVDNIASLNQVGEVTSTSTCLNSIDIQSENLRSSSLNRDLLDICLAKAEDEWTQLQKHYSEVLFQCINIDLGLNGEKLFSNDECNNQIKPYKDEDKQRIQLDKMDCFDRYSERE